MKLNETILKMENISKSFGVVKALKGVELELRAGEVHALMGENGAGKSTLMKILTGIYSRDEGSVVYKGRELDYKQPKDAQDDGIIIVHQELNMMNELTVAENIFIGRESMKGKLIDDEDMVRKARELFDSLGVDIDPRVKVGELSVSKQQMTEIAKAISMDANIIVFDEPTAALTQAEIDELFKIINELRDSGIGIVYISHRMAEIGIISERITVMRDGTYVGTVDTKDTTKDEIIHMMVGRVIYEEPKEKSNVPEDAEVVLEVENLVVDNTVKDVSFKLRKGEILGMAGLMGAGRTEVCRAIFGADSITSGTIKVHGKEVQIKTTTDAVNNGIGYLSEDRRRFGLVTDFDVSNNTVMANLDNYVKGVFIDDKGIVDVTKQFVKDLSIRLGSVKQPVRTLSGGNQQKVVIAKWLDRDSDILIFDEPTRGIDVGAKSEIYSLMNDLVESGKSIIMVSSELTEILRMSDRVLVMCEGRKTGEIAIEDATQENILKLATTREGE